MARIAVINNSDRQGKFGFSSPDIIRDYLSWELLAPEAEGGAGRRYRYRGFRGVGDYEIILLYYREFIFGELHVSGNANLTSKEKEDGFTKIFLIDKVGLYDPSVNYLRFKVTLPKNHPDTEHAEIIYDTIHKDNTVTIKYIKNPDETVLQNETNEPGLKALLESPAKPIAEQREIIETYIRYKKRQAWFARLVKETYDNRCAICRKQRPSLDGKRYEVQAAHIEAVADNTNQNDEIKNGLALCRLHHWAFDEGIIAIGDDFSILVKGEIKDNPDFHEIWEFAGKKILFPQSVQDLPSKDFLLRHRLKHKF